MTVQEAVDILLRVKDIEEPYPSTDEVDEAITVVTKVLDINKVSRLEVISYEKGREYVNWNKEWTLGLEESLQDDGRTLKIFIKN